MNLKQKLFKLNTLTNSFDNNDKKASNSKRLNTEEDTPKALSNLDLSFIKNGVRIKRLSIK